MKFMNSDRLKSFVSLIMLTTFTAQHFMEFISHMNSPDSRFSVVERVFVSVLVSSVIVYHQNSLILLLSQFRLYGKIFSYHYVQNKTNTKYTHNFMKTIYMLLIEEVKPVII